MSSVPQDILDRLTRVDMPKVLRPALPATELMVGGRKLRCHRTGTLVVGTGAAGLRAAVELARLGQPVLAISASIYGGTSACSGSDKQTLHTAGTGNKGDDFRKLARDLGAGGGMDHDTAYIEAVGSVGAFNGLHYMGLPLPQDRFGAVLRYQTDHDEVGRATSCGPRTSRLMVKVLAEEALRLGVPLVPKMEAVRLLTEGEDVARRCIGVVAVDLERWQEPDRGLCVFLAGSVVLATGGPGELYRDSVYPRHCYGSLGMALEAGVETCNLTESQFGIGTRRTEFPWNLSGTYVQVLPYIYSTDTEGREHNFLADYYRTTQELASNIFRKGYQWPCHASRMLEFGSSLVDLAIYREERKGRTVYMDFLRNPREVPTDQPFSLERLDPDVRTYLANNEALQELPIDRLRRMNPLAIELYRMHGTDLTRQPLPFAVNNQHMNGGVAVDLWNRSSLPGLYAVGEVAGTHGVTRPGGAALNAGQVGGMRCARHIHAVPATAPITLAATGLAQVAESLALLDAAQASNTGLDLDAVRDEIQARMSDHAGFVCAKAEVHAAQAAASALRRKAWEQGFACPRPARLVEVFRWRHLALLSEAVLAALARYLNQGGGSRGARAVVDPTGEDLPQTRAEQLGADFRILRERKELRELKTVVCWDGRDFVLEDRPIRAIEDPGRIFFEKNWAPFLTGAIYQDGFRHG